MDITSITVSYSRTHSLPDYCNVKSSLSVTVQAGPHSTLDLDTQIAWIDEEITKYVHGKIDDELERAGQSPVFHEGDLYRLWHWEQWGRDVILADDIVPRGLGDWETITYHGMRLDTVLDLARERERTEGTEWIGPTKELSALREWFHKQTWYRVYALSRFPILREPEIDCLLILPDGLTHARPVTVSGRVVEGGRTPRLRQHQIDRTSALWHGAVLALDSQEELDDYVAGWVEAREADLREDNRIDADEEEDEDYIWPDDEEEKGLLEDHEF